MKMTQAELNEIVAEHGKWLAGKGLKRADLTGADLSRASLSGADLSGANLSGADLSGADLSGANLTGADLSGAYLSGAKLNPIDSARLSIVPETGAFEGWKKVHTATGTAIVRLRIPADAPRSNATGRKCRAGWATVLEGEGVSGHAPETKYAPGLTVRAHEWCTDRWQECAGGIHFFITMAEAEAYDL